MLLGVSETFGSLSCVCAAETVGGLWHILCSQDIQCFVQSYSKLPSVICVHVRHDQPRPSVICMSCVLCNRNLNSLCVCCATETVMVCVDVLCNQDLNGVCVLCSQDLNGVCVCCATKTLMVCVRHVQLRP